MDERTNDSSPVPKNRKRGRPPLARLQNPGMFPNEFNPKLYIKQQATKLFAEKGYYGTSIKEIAEAAMVTKPVVYYHYKSKEGLFRQIIKEGLDTIVTKYRTIASETPEINCFEKLRRIVGVLHDWYNQDKEIAVLVVLFMTQACRHFYDLISDFRIKRDEIVHPLLKQALKEGILPYDNIYLADIVLVSMAINPLMISFSNKTNFAAEQYKNLYFDVFIGDLKKKSCGNSNKSIPTQN
jgi:AcrR family transcriptional regulator